MSGLSKGQVLKIIEDKGRAPEKILAILLAIQEAADGNYVDKEWAKIVAVELNVPLTKIYEVLTFYEMFSTKPRGKYVIEICNSTPCHVSQSALVVQMFTKELGIKMGETTGDNLFSLQYTTCFGACDLAPAVKIGEKVYAHLTDEKVAEVIKTYREGVKCQK